MYVKKFLLTLDLQTFAEEGGGSDETDNTKTDKTNAEKTQTNEKLDEEKQLEEKVVPFARFSEINKKYKELSSQMDQLTKERDKEIKQKEKEQREAKEKTGEFETLYNETKTKAETLESDLTTKTSRIEHLESTVQALLDEQLKDMEKEHLDLIPDLSVEDKLLWVVKAKSRGMLGKVQTDIPIGGSVNPGPITQKTENMSPGDLLRMAFSKK
jgi:predicted RNase H-like nuclease (RuvC/YqgF family)